MCIELGTLSKRVSLPSLSRHSCRPALPQGRRSVPWHAPKPNQARDCTRAEPLACSLFARGRAFACGSANHLLSRSYTATRDHDDSLRPLGDRAVMGDHYEGKATISPKVFEHGEYFIAHVLVEVSCRLISQQHLGLLDERSGDGNSLLLPTRKL